jgi:hypothetical protein
MAHMKVLLLLITTVVASFVPIIESRASRKDLGVSVGGGTGTAVGGDLGSGVSARTGGGGGGTGAAVGGGLGGWC